MKSQCICCQTDKTPLIIFEAKTNNNFGNIVRCPNCNLTSVSPMPEDTTITSYYDGLYESKTYEVNQQQLSWAQNSMKGYIKELQTLGYWPRKNFLDLGGGLGYYSKAAELEGLNSTLVDLDPQSINFAKHKLGLEKSFCMSTSEFASISNGQKYDLIFMRHVIEHYKNPESLIEAGKILLSDRGVMIIETPNNVGIEFLFKPDVRRFFLKNYREKFNYKNWLNILYKQPYAIDPPRHLYSFRISNLNLLLKRKELMIIKSLNYRLGDPIYWPNIKNFTLQECYSSLLQRNLNQLKLRSIDLVSSLICYILHRLGKSSGICIYCVAEH